MKKLLLICSAVAMMCGDCAWGMGDDLYANPWAGESASKPRRNSGAGENPKNSNMARRNSGIISTAMNLLRRSKSDSQLNNENLRQKNYAGSRVVAAQTEQSWNGQTQANPQQLQENRFIKIGDYTYMQYHYDLSNNSKIGYATPTTVITKDDLKNWNDISEIRYANDVSYDKLENPKVILYRNKDNSCYIILRTDDGKKYGVFYGLDERNVEIGRNSFAVYDVSDDVGSFTDGVKRLIYVDESGLYFVPAAGNSVEDVIDSYQKGGKFNFKGSVIKVSAIDGTITWNGNAITEDNFFDNWVKEEREVEKYVSKGSANTFGSNKFSVVVQKEKQIRNVLSTKQPDEKEILRNFYPPKGSYGDMYSRIRGVDKIQLNVFTEIPEKNSSGYQLNLTDRKWMDYFVRMHILTEKSKSKEGCEEVVRNGMFSSFLSNFSSHFRSFSGFSSDIVRAINRQISAKGISDEFIPANGVFFSVLLRDPEFVRGLKKEFASIEAGWKPVKESEMWIPFEIVRNL